MAMRIQKTLSPAAAPLQFTDIASGIAGLFGGTKTVQRFEEELKRTYRVSHCFTLSSGKAALFLILQVLHELSPERDEVLIPAYTCYSVPSAIVRAGLKVRLCDIASDSLDFDFGRLEEQLDNPRLLCVLPTHLFGVPADVKRVKNLASRRGIFVVEDAAQAMGGEWAGRKLGTLGDVGLFSLGRGKAYSTVEGGVILTDNDLIGKALAKRVGNIAGYSALDSLKLILYAVALAVFIHPWIYWLPKSLPFLKLGETHFEPSFPIKRLSSFQAGLAKGWEAKVGALRKIRLKNSRRIAGDGISLLGAAGVEMPCLIRYPILMPDPDTKRALLQKSEGEGLGIADGYPNSIDGINELKGLFAGEAFPGARKISGRIVSLPIHPFVSESDLLRIVQVLRKANTWLELTK